MLDRTAYVASFRGYAVGATYLCLSCIICLANYGAWAGEI